MERDYRYFRLKYSELRRKCRDEIYEIVKENVGENGEERIDIGYDDEGNGIQMKVMCDPIINHITSIGCKREGGDVEVMLYCNEDYPSAMELELDECNDVDAVIRVYNAVYEHFYEGSEDDDDDDDYFDDEYEED